MIRKIICTIFMSHSCLLLAQNQKETGEKFLRSFFNDQIEESTRYLSEAIKDKVSVPVLQQAKGQITLMNGHFENILESKEKDETPYHSVFYKVQFSKNISAIKVVFDSSQKIVGFFNDKYPEEAKQTRPQTPQPPFNYKTEDFTLVNPKDKNTLAGTLTLPKNATSTTPVAILITGSGQQNRNEEIFGHHPFWVIADDFAKKGIGTLRMDDRGIGSSTAGQKNDTSYNYATDIQAAVQYLRHKGYKNIGLIGHSEGGLIAAIVGEHDPKLKFIISLAGPGTSIDELMLKQNEKILKGHMTAEQLHNELDTKKKLFSFIKNYKGTNLAEDFQSYLNKNFPTMSSVEKEAFNSITQAWWVYFLKFEPEKYWSKIKTPVLALNGELDLQVDAESNLKAIETALKKGKNKNYKITKLPQLNHLFQTAKTGAPSEYDQIEESFSPEVLKIMSEWILSLKL